MHVDQFVRGKGRFIITQYVATDEKVTRKYPLILTTGRILSQYNVGAQTRRTENVRWHAEDRLEIHPHDAEERGIKDGDWVGIQSRAGETVLRAHGHRADAAGRGLHHLPLPRIGRQRDHHRQLGLGHQLPRVQGDGGAGDAGAAAVRMAARVRALQRDAARAGAKRGRRSWRRWHELRARRRGHRDADQPPAGHAPARRRAGARPTTSWPRKCRWRWNTTASRTR